MGLDYQLILAEIRAIHKELESTVETASSIAREQRAATVVFAGLTFVDQVRSDADANRNDLTATVPDAPLHADLDRATGPSIIDRPTIVDPAVLQELAYPSLDVITQVFDAPASVTPCAHRPVSSWATSTSATPVGPLRLLRPRLVHLAHPRLLRPRRAPLRLPRLHRPRRAPPRPPQLRRPRHAPPRLPRLRRPWRPLPRPPWHMTHERRRRLPRRPRRRRCHPLRRLCRLLPFPASASITSQTRLQPKTSASPTASDVASSKPVTTTDAPVVFDEMSHQHQPPTASEPAPVFTFQCAALTSAVVLHVRVADRGAVVSAQVTIISPTSISVSVLTSAHELFGGPLRRYITMLFPTPMLDVLWLDCATTMHERQSYQKMAESGLVMFWPTQINQQGIFTNVLEKDVDLWSPWPLQVEIRSVGAQLRPTPWPSFYCSVALVQWTQALVAADVILPKPPWLAFDPGTLFRVNCNYSHTSASLQYALQPLLAVENIQSRCCLSGVTCFLKENIVAYFSILHGFLLVCNRSMVDAGPPLHKCSCGSAKNVPEAVWAACAALAKVPTSNGIAIGRIITNLGVHLVDVLGNMTELPIGGAGDSTAD